MEPARPQQHTGSKLTELFRDCSPVHLVPGKLGFLAHVEPDRCGQTCGKQLVDHIKATFLHLSGQLEPESKHNACTQEALPTIVSPCLTSTLFTHIGDLLFNPMCLIRPGCPTLCQCASHLSPWLGAALSTEGGRWSLSARGPHALPQETTRHKHGTNTSLASYSCSPSTQPHP